MIFGEILALCPMSHRSMVFNPCIKIGAEGRNHSKNRKICLYSKYRSSSCRQIGIISMFHTAGRGGSIDPPLPAKVPNHPCSSLWRLFSDLAGFPVRKPAGSLLATMTTRPYGGNPLKRGGMQTTHKRMYVYIYI